MTAEAALARDLAVHFECKLDALRRNQDGTVKLTLTLQAIDCPKQLLTDDMGQRYVCALVAKNDDETPKVSAFASAGKAPEGSVSHPPVAGKVRFANMTYAKQAGILCSDREFQKWLARKHPEKFRQASLVAAEDLEEAAAIVLRWQCNVSSRTDIDRSDEARDAFNRMFTAFDVERKYGAM